MKPTQKKNGAGRKKLAPINAERTPDWKRAARTVRASKGDDAKAILKRLAVSAEELATAPQISTILKLVDGGVKKCVEAMRLTRGDEVITRFLRKYDSLSTHDRVNAPVEAICIAAGIDPVHLLGSVTIAMERLSISLVKLLCVSNHIKIVQARIKYGQLPGGDRDRLALDTAMGFLPSPKGATIINKAIFGSGKSVMDQQPQLDSGGDEPDEAAITNPADYDLDKLFPPANAMQERLVLIRQRMLPDPSKVN